VPEEMKVPGLVLERVPQLLERHFLRKPYFWVLGGLVVLSIAGYLVLPSILQSILQKQLSEKLHRQATIRDLKINPFELSVQINGLFVKDRDGSRIFASFEELYLNFQAMSLFEGGPVIRDIRLRAPDVTIIRNEDQTYNFSDLLQEFGTQGGTNPKSSPDSRPLRFSLNNIQIEGGSIDFEDRPTHMRHAVRDINIAIPFVSNLPYYLDTYVQPAFHAKVNGTPVALAGKTKPFSDSRETVLEINISNFEIPKYLEYLPVQLKFKILSGSLDTKLSLSFTQYQNKSPALLVSGTAALNKLSVADLNSSRILNLALLDVAVESADVFSKKLNLRSLLIQSPEVTLVRAKTGTLNLKALLPQENDPSSPTSVKATGPPLSIEATEVRLAEGKIHFTDETTEKTFHTNIEALNMAIHHFSTAPKKSSALDVSLTTDAGEIVKYTGTLTVEPFASEGLIELHQVPVKRYAPYYGQHLLFSIEDGIVDVSSRYQYSSEGSGQTTLSSLAVALKSVRLKKKGEPEEFLKVPSLSLKNTDVDLGKRTIHIGEFSTAKGAISIIREKDGTLNLNSLIPPAPVTRKKEAAPPTTRTAPAPAWLVLFKRLAVERYAVKLEDRTLSEPTTLIADPVNITAENLSTGKSNKGKASLGFMLNKTGTVTVSGPVSITPLATNLKLNIKGIDLVPLQPYFTDRIKIAVTGGAVSANGNLAVTTTPENTMAAVFIGDASLSKLTTVDKVNSEDFLKWDLLKVTGINAGNKPLQLEIEEIALTDFYSRLIVNSDGTFNVQGIVASDAKATPKSTPEQSPEEDGISAKPAEPMPIRIGKVTLQGGDVSFSDRFIKPSYSAKLTGLAGTVSGLSSEESQQADVNIGGQLGTGAPLQIAGKINPLSKDLFLDLNVDFKDIELSPLTPYSAKYAGYTIEKGKLSLSLKYFIENGKLHAENKVFIDQFTFGDKVESPDATNLPVRLAVSLLKDRNGEINLDLPVTGSLDDPQFSVWGVIVKIITNLLTKAATAPFALLGALGSGAEELMHVEFEYGQSDLNGSMETRLKRLATILYERPSLKLEVTGHADTVKDQAVLRQQQFDRKIRAAKLTELLKKGTPEKGAPPVSSLEEIRVTPNEYARYLTLAYKKETFSKPCNFLGMVKDLEVPEMERLILTNIKIPDDELRQLAMQRAQSVKDYLITPGKVEPERIFLVTAGTSSQERKDKLKDSRVDLSIR